MKVFFIERNFHLADGPASKPTYSEGPTRFLDPGLVRLNAERLVLVGGECASCRALSFPKAAVCPECLSTEVSEKELAREGTLYSFSVIHQAPPGWTTPFTIGYVDLADGVRVLGHILGPIENIKIGSRVSLTHGPVATDAAGGALCTYIFSPQAEAGN